MPRSSLQVRRSRLVEGETLPASTVVAAFNDTYVAAPQSGFSATIDWGNGTSSVGTINAVGNGHYTVTGSTLYPENGAYSITVTINDAGGATSTATSQIQVADAPLSSTSVNLSGTEGKAIPNTVMATFNDENLYAEPSDFDVTIDWGDGSTTTGATVTTVSAGNFEVTASHLYEQAGTYTATVTILDVGGQVGGSTTVADDVATIADVPLVAGPPLTLTPVPGAPYAGSIAQFTDPIRSVNLRITLPASTGETVTTSSGVITPTAPPVATNDTYNTPEGKTLTVTTADGVLSNDISPTGVVLTPTLVSQPADGTLTFNTDGSFTYVPNAGFVGTDTFSYRDADSLNTSNTATVTLTVTPATNQSPVASDDAYTTTEGMTLTVVGPGVLANDTDPSSKTLTPTLLTSPADGTLAFNQDGSFIYTPDAGFVGTDSFTYFDFDGTHTSNTATVTLNVLPTVTAGANGATFTVTPSTPHTYTRPTAVGQAPYAIQVLIVDLGGQQLTIPASATVADAPIVSSAVSGLQTVQGTPLSATVATFTDSNTQAVASDFTASINWGDGNISSGTITYDPTTRSTRSPARTHIPRSAVSWRSPRSRTITGRCAHSRPHPCRWPTRRCTQGPR